MRLRPLPCLNPDYCGTGDWDTVCVNCRSNQGEGRQMTTKTDTPQELAPLDQADIEMVKDSRIKVQDLQWLTREEGYIRLGYMQDSHLRNAALMLMGLGYQQYNAPDDLKIRWLTAFRMEWERRMSERRTTGLAKTTH